MEPRTANREPRNTEAPSDWIERAHVFAVRIIKMSDRLPRTPAGRTITGQIVRSAPSVVMNLEEARGALTRCDTLHKTGIARREARETRRWLLVIRDAEFLPSSKLTWLLDESNELVAMLTAGCKRLQASLAEQENRP